MARKDISGLAISLSVQPAWLERLLTEHREGVEAFYARRDKSPLKADGTFKEIHGIPTPVTFEKRTK
jgi:hypothetical protein